MGFVFHHVVLAHLLGSSVRAESLFRFFGFVEIGPATFARS